jgi:hypothetical protein
MNNIFANKYDFNGRRLYIIEDLDFIYLDDTNQRLRSSTLPSEAIVRNTFFQFYFSKLQSFFKGT